MRNFYLSLLGFAFCSILIASDATTCQESIAEWITWANNENVPSEVRYQKRQSLHQLALDAITRILEKYLVHEDTEEFVQLLQQLKTEKEQDVFNAILVQQIATRPPEERRKLIGISAHLLSEKQKLRFIDLMVFQDHDPNSYDDELQNFIVKQLPQENLKISAYLILSPEKKQLLLPYLTEQAIKLQKMNRSQGGGGKALLATLFLAYDGHREGTDILLEISKNLNRNNSLDFCYVPIAMALSGNQELLQALGEMVLTQKDRKWNGRDAMPQQRSFAYEAAASLALVVDGFPQVSFDEFFSDKTELECEEFVRSHKSLFPLKNYAILAVLLNSRLYLFL